MNPAPYYRDEHVTLYHGNCLDVEEWTTADVLVCDPPYGIAYKQGGARTNNAGVKSLTPVANIAGDLSPAIRDNALAVWGDRPALVFGTWRIPRPPTTRQRLIWFKSNTNPGLGTGTPWSPADEEIYVLGTGWVGPRTLNVYETKESRASAGGLAALTGHPTPKPVGLMERLIQHTTGVVADPFAGSGATLIAARNIGRTAIGVEIEERYCELIAKRLGQQAFDFGDWDGAA